MSVRQLEAGRVEGTASRAVGDSRNALLLTPSRGLGGGIERYVETIESAFADQGLAIPRLDLSRPGPAGHRALLRATADALASTAGPTRLILAHRALLPVAALAALRSPVRGISVICHGSDVWGPRGRVRWQLESRLMRRADVRVVAVSSFTAGALFPGPQAAILPPGLSSSWYGELVAAAEAAPRPRDTLEITTTFRLDDWRDKGIAQLIAAIEALGRPDVRLTVCGSGTPPPALTAQLADRSWCTLRPNLSDRELAAQLAAADLFVLATRTRSGRVPCGEGFGLVLIEAQVAGTAVVGPAHGGSPDAYLDGITGATPRDESVTALADVLDALLREPERLSTMGARGADWARERFAPGRYAELAVDRLL